MNTLFLSEANLQDEDQRREFLDLNALDHQTIFDALLDAINVPIPKYPLEALDITLDWLMTHDQEHKSIAAVLGLPVPVDLDTLNPDDPVQAVDWLSNHAIAHGQIVARLGL